MQERVRRDQLDGVVSGGMLCMRLAPTMRVMRILGLFQSRAELSYVLGRLKPTIDEEMRRGGFYDFGLISVGPELIYSRKPIHSMAELRATRLWGWDVDDVMPGNLRALGIEVES